MSKCGTERLIAGEDRTIGADQLPAQQQASCGSTASRGAPPQLKHRAAMKHRALDRGTLAHDSLRRVELIQPRREAPGWKPAPTPPSRRRRPSPSWRSRDPSSINIETNSSANSGFPSAASAMRCRSCNGGRLPSRRSTSSWLAGSERGSRWMMASAGLPPPQPGRRSSSSPRAAQTSRMGASRDRSAMCSMVEQRWLGPVNVLEAGHERASACDRLGTCGSTRTSRQARPGPRAAQSRAPHR